MFKPKVYGNLRRSVLGEQSTKSRPSWSRSGGMGLNADAVYVSVKWQGG